MIKIDSSANLATIARVRRKAIMAVGAACVLARPSDGLEVVHCNAAFCELVGHTMVGSSLKGLAPASGADALASAIGAAVKGDVSECHLALCTATSAHPVLLRARASLVPRDQATEGLPNVPDMLLSIRFVVASNLKR